MLITTYTINVHTREEDDEDMTDADLDALIAVLPTPSSISADCERIFRNYGDRKRLLRIVVDDGMNYADPLEV